MTLSPRFLDRQIKLLDYLTSERAIFGSAASGSHDEPAPAGFDAGLLRLEASFSHDKRMEKITAVFPQTFRLLGPKQAEIVREFTRTCQPTDISRIENARQFYEFILRQEPLGPPYLHDVAACEFSLARARLAFESGELDPPRRECSLETSVRRKAGVILLNCRYDIRAIFETGDERVLPIERVTPLAIVVPPGAQHPQVFELPPVAFRMLAALDDWTAASELTSLPDLNDLVREFAEHGLVQVRP